MIPEPPPEGVLAWSIKNPDAPRQTVQAVNRLIRMRVRIVQSGASSMLVGDNEAVLTISTKDIDLGTITGSKASNAALSSLMAALRRVFTVSDSTS